MSEILFLLLALLGGILLGAIFFGGLWWTVRRGVASNQPAVWFLSSLLLRTMIAVSGFYFLMHGDWRRLLACLFGFLVARFCIVSLSNSRFQKSSQMIQEGAA